MRTFSQKYIADIKNEMEKRQKDGDAVFTDNNSNNNATADEAATTPGTDETVLAVDAADDIPATLLNGDNANNQQNTSDVIAY